MSLWAISLAEEHDKAFHWAQSGVKQATAGARGLHQERGRWEEDMSSVLSLSPDPDLLLGATSNILTHLQIEKGI